jgi:hypothetical protein
MLNDAKQKRKKRRFKIILTIVLLLVCIRLALPYVILHYANRNLAGLRTLYGHIDDIDISIYRGAYKIDHLYINKKDSITGEQTDFFKTKMIDLSIEWEALFKGRLVGEIILEEPVVIFTRDKSEPKDIQKDSTDLKTILDNFMPLKINRLEVKQGKLKYADKTSKPPVDIEMNNTYILAQNLSSVVDSSLLPSKVMASANVYGGTLFFNMTLNALKKEPTFDLNLDLKNTQLSRLNNFFQAYANVDVNLGTFGLYTEVAAKEGKYAGYVKPLINDLDVLGKEDKEDTFWQKAREAVVGSAGYILTNSKKDQIATKVEFQGNFKSTDLDTWSAIIELLRNAFIRALQPSIDHEINIRTVDKQLKKEEKKGFLKKVFGGGKKKK